MEEFNDRNENENKNSSYAYSSSLNRNKNLDTIPFRIEYIKNLLSGKQLEPLIDLSTEEYNTEKFINNHNTDENDNKDTRIVLSKKILNFFKIINQIGGKLMYIKSGTTGHTFKGIISENNDTMNYAVKVVAYSKKEKYGDLHDITRPENAELMTIKLLSYFVIKRQTPHIVLPMGTFDTSIKPFIELIEKEIIDDEDRKYMEFIEKYKKGEYYDNVSILISEWANRGDLLDYIKKNYQKFSLIHWKVIFFQLLSTLAVIHSKYKTFRHNDLKANNILIHKIKDKSKKFTYIVKRMEYVVPNIGYQIKLWDFDFACIDGQIENSKVNSMWAKKINITKKQNRYYDMHYFFNTLIKRGFFPQFMEDDIIPKEAKDFVNRIIPKKYQEGMYVHKRGRILVNDEYMTPNMVIRTDPFFEDFRKFVYKKTNIVKPCKHNFDSTHLLDSE